MNSSNRQILNPYRRLRAGCYSLHFRPKFPYWGSDDNPDDKAQRVTDYKGTLRVIHFNNDGTTALSFEEINNGRNGQVIYLSGDLYAVPPSDRDLTYTEIPVYPISDYRFYLLATDTQEVDNAEFQITFQSHEFLNGEWVDRGMATAQLGWSDGSAGSPSMFDFLTGRVWNESGVDIGELELTWISPYLRQATLEFDRVEKVRSPLDNYSQVTTKFPTDSKFRKQRWKTVFQECGWLVDVIESDQPAETASKTWSEPELLGTLPALRDSFDVDHEWRYQIFCVANTDDGGRGYKLDAKGIDSGSRLFESVVLAAKYQFPSNLGPEWRELAGQTLDATPAYFRTAVHEVGHALGLEHNFTTSGFMATTDAIGQIALKSKKSVLSEIAWSFAPDDLQRLRLWPDIVVRSGGGAPKLSLPGIDDFRLVPLYGGETDEDGEPVHLDFEIKPLLEVVPLGAPVRIELTLTNRGAHKVMAPKLRLKTSNLSGSVQQGGESRSFLPVAETLDELGVEPLEPGKSITGSVTLLRGPNGALFPRPGEFKVTVNLRFYLNQRYFTLTRSTQINVAPFVDQRQLRVATLLLETPDSLLSFAIGGDGLSEGNQATNLALSHPILRPHFEIVRLKRLCRGIGQIGGALSQALSIFGAEEKYGGAILTTAETASLTKLAMGSVGITVENGKLNTGKFLMTHSLESDLKSVAARIILGNPTIETLNQFLQRIQTQTGPKRGGAKNHSVSAAAAAQTLKSLLQDKIGLSEADATGLHELLSAKAAFVFNAVGGNSTNKNNAEKLKEAVHSAGFSKATLSNIVDRIEELALLNVPVVTQKDLQNAGERIVESIKNSATASPSLKNALIANLKENLLNAGARRKAPPSISTKK